MKMSSKKFGLISKRILKCKKPIPYLLLKEGFYSLYMDCDGRGANAMTLPSNLPLSRICQIPLIILLFSTRSNCVQLDIGEAHLPISHLFAAILFLIASTT